MIQILLHFSIEKQHNSALREIGTMVRNIRKTFFGKRFAHGKISTLVTTPTVPWYATEGGILRRGCGSQKGLAMVRARESAWMPP